MSRKSECSEKLTVQVNFRFPENLRRALADLARLAGQTEAEYVRQMIDREWTKNAEDIRAIDEIVKRAKKRAA